MDSDNFVINDDFDIIYYSILDSDIDYEFECILEFDTNVILLVYNLYLFYLNNDISSKYTPITKSFFCSICHSQTTENEECINLNQCKHEFHKNCLLTWFSYKSNCPLCRTDVM
jgi:hypothetical protein